MAFFPQVSLLIVLRFKFPNSRLLYIKKKKAPESLWLGRSHLLPSHLTVWNKDWITFHLCKSQAVQSTEQAFVAFCALSDRRTVYCGEWPGWLFAVTGHPRSQLYLRHPACTITADISDCIRDKASNWFVLKTKSNLNIIFIACLKKGDYFPLFSQCS